MKESAVGMVTLDGARVANAWDNGPLGQTANTDGIPYYGTRGALIGAGAAATAAVATAAVEYFIFQNQTILVEGWAGLNPLDKGGIAQLRVQGTDKLIRLDWGPVQPYGKGPSLPHIDGGPWNWHHWPW